MSILKAVICSVCLLYMGGSLEQGKFAHSHNLFCNLSLLPNWYSLLYVKRHHAKVCFRLKVAFRFSLYQICFCNIHLCGNINMRVWRKEFYAHVFLVVLTMTMLLYLRNWPTREHLGSLFLWKSKPFPGNLRYRHKNVKKGVMSKMSSI